MTRRIAFAAAALALVVVVLGAYVRLSDAGLGCPDWPGCYGQLTPHHAVEAISEAQAAAPEGPVSHAKAWKEMVHRYFAGTLGLMVFALAVIAWRRGNAIERRLAGALAILIVFQALLGMWTVTLLLKPLVVTGHLLGGLATFALLLWLALHREGQDEAPLRRALGLGMLLVALQVFLGGWVSSNYAALACPDFPVCRGEWWPESDFAQGFAFGRELGQDAHGETLPMQALVAIHLAHRAGALLVFGYLAWLAIRIWRESRTAAAWLFALTLGQGALGIGNVLLGLPLPVAVAHNAGAALLLGTLIAMRWRLRRARP